MSRYVNRVEVKDPNVLTNEIASFLESKGFKLANYNGEPVWQKGQGVMTAAQYIVIHYEPAAVIVQAFVGAFGLSEMDLKGFVAIVSKRPLKKVVTALEEMLKAKGA